MKEQNPDDKAAVKDIENFCITPAVFNANKVIVQSENMREIYINVLTDFMKEKSKGDTRKYWEKKILGLGSPKTDKILCARKEHTEVPEEWRKVIEKADGSRKKVIFYNTGVTALLQHGEKLLDKIEDTFKEFREKKEETALLWRPHPLFRATLASMRPGLEERYERIAEEYCREGWGIYDDTSDLDRAVAISDVYYGDASSVVQLFNKANKRALIQNVRAIYHG